MSYVTGRGLATLPVLGQGSEDPETAQKMRGGEAAELGALFRELSPDLFRYLRGVVLRDSDGLAEDIVQETFLTLWRKWPDVRSHPQLRAWLYTVGRRHAIDALSKRYRELPQDELPEPAAEGGDPSDSYDFLMSAREAIEKLPPRQREAVRLFYIEDFTQSQIATMMEIKRETVAALLYQARHRLAELLGQAT